MTRRKCLSIGRPATEYRSRVTASLARFSERRHRSLPWRDARSPSSPHRESITGHQAYFFYSHPVTFRRWKSSRDNSYAPYDHINPIG